LHRAGEFSEKTFEAFDDVEKDGVVHQDDAATMMRAGDFCESRDSSGDFSGQLAGGKAERFVLMKTPARARA
jgi:hypothetical protein